MKNSRKLRILPLAIAALPISAPVVEGTGTEGIPCPSSRHSLAPIEAKAASALSKETLRKMLNRIESEPAPQLYIGAMCYSPAPISNELVQYICPKCGQKTLHAPHETPHRPSPAKNISDMRRLVAKIREHTQAVILLEDEFCQHCPRLKKNLPPPGTPEAKLRIRFNDGTEKITRGVTYDDLLLLLGFFKGDLKRAGSHGEGAIPLKPSLNRLKVLLGESLPDTPDATAEKPRTGTYTIVAGDTLSKIARAHRMPLEDLITLNPGVIPTRLKIGATLTVHLPPGSTDAPTP